LNRVNVFKAMVFNASVTKTFSFTDDSTGNWGDAKTFNDQASLSNQCSAYFGFQTSFNAVFDVDTNINGDIEFCL